MRYFAKTGNYVSKLTLGGVHPNGITEIIFEYFIYVLWK
jgi:hypothetical protein